MKENESKSDAKIYYYTQLHNICLNLPFQVNKSLTVHEDSCPHLSEGCTCDEKNGILREEFICSLSGSKCPNQGNLSKGIDKKTVKREGVSICLLMFSSQ